MIFTDILYNMEGDTGCNKLVKSLQDRIRASLLCSFIEKRGRNWGTGIRTPTNWSRVSRATVTLYPSICNGLKNCHLCDKSPQINSKAAISHSPYIQRADISRKLGVKFITFAAMKPASQALLPTMHLKAPGATIFRLNCWLGTVTPATSGSWPGREIYP